MSTNTFLHSFIPKRCFGHLQDRRHQESISYVNILIYIYFLLNRSFHHTGRLAIKHHPDKNPDDPHAEERFKDIAIAYQTLSDPVLRAKYNEFGPKESAPEGGYVDPEEVFGAIFGGERFLPIIGTISLARDMKAALQEAEDAEGSEVEGGKKVIRDNKGREILSEEEKAKKEEKARKVAAEVCKLHFLSSPRDSDLVNFTESSCTCRARQETRRPS